LASESFRVEEEDETKENKGNPGNPSRKAGDDLPVKLLHTKDTRVGHEDRPEPAETESPGDGDREEKEKPELDDEHKDKIWQ